MKHPSLSLHAVVTFSFALASAAATRAQSPSGPDTSSAPPAPAPASSVPAPDQTAPSPNESQTVLMNAFDVTGTAENGYAASESVTGTRDATKIADLPFSVGVVTGDFIKDFSLFDLNQQLSFVSGFSPSDGENNGLSTPTLFQLRGFQSPTTLVDGFRRVGLVDESAIDRIEVIKGTAADIYGAIVPGGVVNIITKAPTTTPTQTLDVSYGAFVNSGIWAVSTPIASPNTENLSHADLSSSGPIDAAGKLLYRFDLAYEYLPYGQEFAQRQSTYGDIQLLYKPNADTDFRIQAEFNDLYAHPRVRVPTIEVPGYYPYQPNLLSTLYTGTAFANQQTDGLPAEFNGDGPQSYDHNRETALTLTFEHRFSDVWTVRGAANGFEDKDHQIYSTSGYYPLGHGSVPGPAIVLEPQWILDPQNGGGYQVDSLVKLNNSWVSNKFLVTNDYEQISKVQWDYENSAVYYNPNASPLADSIAGQTIPPWDYPLPETEQSFYKTAAYNNWSTYEDYGLFASDSASFFNDRLIAMFGERYDFVWNEVKNYIFTSPVTGKTGQQDTNYGVHAWTHELGLLGKVTDNVSLFVNASTSFNPQSQLDQNANPLPNNSASGYEFGTKAQFFDGRLNFSVDHFEDNEFDLAHNTRNSLDAVVTILSGQETAKGYEADMNWQVTPALVFFGGYGYTNARIIEAAGAAFLNNTPLPQVPTDNLGIAGRYTIQTGLLKGLFFMATENYQSKSLISIGSGTAISASAADPIYNVPFPNGNLPFPNLAPGTEVTSGATLVPDGREDIFNDPYALLGAGVGYAFMTGRISHEVKLNATNLLNRYYTFGQAAPGNPLEIIMSYGLKY